MKRIHIQIILFLSFFSGISNSFAQSGWYPLPNGPISKHFTDIYFINEDTGFVSAEDLGSLRTTDGGATWTYMNGATGKWFKFFKNNKLGFSYGVGSSMTTDYGLTWTTNSNIYLDVEFPSDSVGYTIGLNADSLYATLGKTTDGGKTWVYKKTLRTPVDKMKVVRVYALAFRDDLHGFVTVTYEASDGSGAIFPGFYTSDGAEEWKTSISADQRLFLIDSTWLFAYSDAINKSNDDFQTNRQVSLNKIPPDAQCDPVRHICKYDNNIISAISVGDGAIFRSIDGGETWYQQLCHASTVNLEWNYGAISTPSKLVGYAVGLDSQIYKTTDGGGPPFTSIVMTKPCDCEFTASPNPAQAHLSLSFKAAVAEESLEIFDALGRQVSKEIIPANTNSYTLDIRRYASGAYYVRYRNKTARFVKF